MRKARTYHVFHQPPLFEFDRAENSVIRSVDPENPSLGTNMEWIGIGSPFARYSPLNYTVTLKLGFGVTQGHRKWHHSIEHTRLYMHRLYA